jgi:ADP-ribose pyrophosphatase YjhB (NUDIX family)
MVAGAIIESPDGILLVCNRRFNGTHDWSPPGGVIELEEGEDVLDGLRREVAEETGLLIERWGPLRYSIEAVAPVFGWVMTAQVWSAEVAGFDLAPDDPDGIVVDATFVHHDCCGERLAASHDWVREPLLDWLAERWEEPRSYRYALEGTTPGSATIVRL